MKKKIKPTFNKKMPENVKEFFRQDSDYEFKKEHPVAYKVLATIGCIALFGPTIIYLLFVFYVNPECNSMWLIPGFIGTVSIGIGLFNIVGAFLNQYLGHMVTLVCLIGGGIFTAVSCINLYDLLYLRGIL